jgi:hypothetical protein
VEVILKHPTDIQSALLFDTRFTNLDTFVQKAEAVLSAKTGLPFNYIEAKPGVFYRIYGGGDLMITLEYVDGRANTALFEPALSSPITTILCPDIRARIDAHKSMILINVSHGTFGGSAEIQRLLNQLEFADPYATYQHFVQRLEACELLTLIAQETTQACAIHWTQSDQLLDSKTFEVLSAGTTPKPLHVHPFLFGDGQSENGQQCVGVLGFGANHFVDRQVSMRPSTLPWHASYETIFVFLRVALMPNGYIIPDTDTFGNESQTESYRVHHVDAKDGEAPKYEVEPLLHKEFNFQSPTYVERVGPTFDDRNIPGDLLPKQAEEREQTITSMRQTREMAERAGVRFDVRRVVGGRMVPPSEPAKPKSLFSRFASFGRKN